MENSKRDTKEEVETFKVMWEKHKAEPEGTLKHIVTSKYL